VKIINSSRIVGVREIESFSLSRQWLMAISVFMITALFFSSPARAEFSMLAGAFDGGEPKLSAYSCGPGSAGTPYQTVDFSVSADGVYGLANAFSSWDGWDGDLPGYGLDVWAEIYEGAVNLDFLHENRLAAQVGSYYDQAQVPLKAGRSYTLMLVVLPCATSAPSGTWVFMFDGNGAVQSEARREIPEFSTGRFDEATPLARGRCGEKLLNLDVAYKQTGPIRVASSGTYYFSNVNLSEPVGTCQAIYTAPIDPSNVEAHLVGSGPIGPGFEDYDYGSLYTGQWAIELQADTDYWLVTQPEVGATASGSYFFVMAPPAPFRINPGLTGLWADLNTPGQGMYLDVFNSIDSVFMAWFTYDLQRPGPGANSVLGDPGHRWLTGLGAIDGSSSEIEAVWTAGGLFDSSNPRPSRSVRGHVRLEFDSCISGRAIYDFGPASVSGVVNLQRPYEDALGIAQCEQFNQGPGIPGPL